MDYKYNVPSLSRLIHELQKLPGVGPRSAHRWASWFLKANLSDINNLRQSLEDIRTKVRRCSSCFTLTEEKHICKLCTSSRREDIICVVEEPFDIIQIESSGKFKGKYHVLHGTLSPLNQVHPENLTITPLIDKIKTQNIKEVILALDADMEGDMTVLYLSKLLKNHPVTISRLANGIPLGGDIDYIDEQAVGIAMENRVEI